MYKNEEEAYCLVSSSSNTTATARAAKHRSPDPVLSVHPANPPTRQPRQYQQLPASICYINKSIISVFQRSTPELNKSSTALDQQGHHLTIHDLTYQNRIPSVHLHRPTAAMCKYYAHTHPCGHTKTVFAAFCPQSALIQKPCGRGEIWATVKMDKDCAHCYEEPEPLVPRSRTGGRKKIVGRR